MKGSGRVPGCAALTVLFIVAVGSMAFAQSGARMKWQPPKTLLASTTERRARAAERLGISKGEYVVALLSIQCGECDREAKALNNKRDTGRIIAIASAPLRDVAAWKARLGLKYRVIAVSDQTFDDFGGVILPTLVLLREGYAIGVAEKAEVVE